MRALKKLWTKPVTSPGSRTRPHGLGLEILEDRAVPAVLYVDDDGAQRFNSFRHIQDAVNAAGSGDTIKVYQGTYAEQVVIPANKDRLVLQSVVEHQAVIVPPPVFTDMVGFDGTGGALIHVDGAKKITIDGFTLRGTHLQLQAGIVVDMNGSATITDNVVTDIQRGGALGVIAESYGIVIGGLTAEELSGDATIARNSITNYEKAGILVFDPASKVSITSNTIQGIPNSTIAQNGIQVSYGASADIGYNTISNNLYTPLGTEATGILTSGPVGKVKIHHNLLNGNEIGIAAEFITSTLEISKNVIIGGANTQDGIWLNDVRGAKIVDNISTGHGRSGIYVFNGSSNNKIEENDFRGNAGFDAYDDTVGNRTAGTANNWSNNRCNDDNRGGRLCSAHGDGDHGDDDDDDHDDDGHGNGDDDDDHDD